jgi:hypothetical protein
MFIIALAVQSGVTTLAITGDGRRALAASGMQKTLNVWDADVWNTGPGLEVAASADDCRDRRTGYLHDLDSGGSAGFVSDL